MLKWLWSRKAKPDLQHLLNQAHDLFDQGQSARALELYEIAVRQQPDAATYVNLGYCHLALGDPVNAQASFSRAADLEPALAAASVGLGDVAVAREDHQSAIARYDEAIGLRPDFAVAYNNRAQSRLALGDLVGAWADAEWRFDIPQASSLYPYRINLPRWRGEPLDDQRLLVHWEQGFGDMIQHLRFLPLLERRHEAFAFECPPPLRRLVARMLPEHQLITATSDPPNRHAPGQDSFSAYVPLLSLPHVLGITEADLPQRPYLGADPRRAESLRKAWRKPNTPLAGMVWQGSAFDVSRSARLVDFLPLAASGLQLVSLQVGASPEDKQRLAAAGAIDASPTLDDFASTADAISALDVVISVDTAVAHLAGAMGKPTMLLLNEPAAVRWMRSRPDSLWYPSMRILRKAATAPWSPLVAEAAILAHAYQTGINSA